MKHPKVIILTGPCGVGKTTISSLLLARIDAHYLSGDEIAKRLFPEVSYITKHPDNQSLYFVADYPPDLWHLQRTADGDWATPTKMIEVSTEKDDWYVTLSRKQNLYFTNGTVFKSSLKNGEYSSKVKVESLFNSKDTRDPCISPNEDYMIFAATDSLTANQSDLFISFVDPDGSWTAAQNLGNIINTEYLEFAPYISPDERFLFFSRREKWQNATFSNIYWVDLKVIEKFRGTVH